MTTRTRLAATLAAAAVLTTTGLLGAAPAQAVPPTSRTVKDAVEPGKAYDITEVTLRSAPKSKRPAVVLIRYGRTVKTGDVVDVWFDLDKDKVPDVHLSGNAFSEYTVYRTSSFTKDGKNISGKDCVRLSMAGGVSKVRMFPACLGDPLTYSVAVKSSVLDRPDSTQDWAPGTERFTKPVLAAPLS